MRRHPPSLSDRMTALETWQDEARRRLKALETHDRRAEVSSLQRWLARAEPEIESMRTIRSTWRVVTGGSVVALVASIVALGKLLGWW